MKRARIDKAAGEAITRAVAEIEKQTDAEVVIVMRGRSGSYRHADYLCGAILAFVGLLFVLFSPFSFSPIWIPLDVVAVFAAGAFLCSRTDALRRLLTTKKYRSSTARQSAAAMFYEAGIANTQSENGLLIYLSLLERQLEVIADRGILKAVPPLQWNTAIFELKEIAHRYDSEKFIEAVNQLGVVLAEHLPATGENPNELVDGARIDLK